MIELKALKSFLGQPGEGSPGDNMVRRGDVFRTDNNHRARALERRGLVERVNGRAPAAANKMQPVHDNKSAATVPLDQAAARKAETARKSAEAKAAKQAARRGSPTGAPTSPSSSEPGLPLPPNGNGSEDTSERGEGGSEF